jgi:C4-type Zn-finger protein
MFAVEIEKRCGCFTRAKLHSNISFDTKKEALKKADEMLEVMNKQFCGKHKFKIIEEDKTIRIVEDEEN